MSFANMSEKIKILLDPYSKFLANNQTLVEDDKISANYSWQYLIDVAEKPL